MSMNHYETIVFFNSNVGTHKRRDCDRYMDYLHKIGKYSTALDNFISEQVAKQKVELSSDIQIRSDLKPDEYEKINLEDRFLYLMTDNKVNYTNLFYLDNDYILNDDEIELMKNTWFTKLDLMDDVIFDPKVFREDFEFEYRNNYNLQRFENNIDWLTKHSNSKAWNEFKDEFNFDEQAFKRRLTNSHDSKEFIKKMARKYNDEERQMIDDWVQDWVDDHPEYKEDYNKAISKFTNGTLSDFDKKRGVKYKLAFMLFDFYNSSDPAFKSMVKENFVDTNAKYIDDIFERLYSEQSQKHELLYVSEIVDTLKQNKQKDTDLKDAIRIGEGIIRFAENNLDFVDYTDKINKLAALAKRNNISFNTTPDDLIKLGIITPVEVSDIVTNIMVEEAENEKTFKELDRLKLNKRINKAAKQVSTKRSEGCTEEVINQWLDDNKFSQEEKDIILGNKAMDNTSFHKEIEQMEKKIQNIQENRKTYVYDNKKLYELLKEQYENGITAQVEAERKAREQARIEAEKKEQADKTKYENLQKQADKFGFKFYVFAPPFKHYKDVWILDSTDDNNKYHVAYLDLNDKVTQWHDTNIDKFNVKCAEIAKNDELIKKIMEQKAQRDKETIVAAKASKEMEM